MSITLLTRHSCPDIQIPKMIGLPQTLHPVLEWDEFYIPFSNWPKDPLQCRQEIKHMGQMWDRTRHGFAAKMCQGTWEEQALGKEKYNEVKNDVYFPSGQGKINFWCCEEMLGPLVAKSPRWGCACRLCSVWAPH